MAFDWSQDPQAVSRNMDIRDRLRSEMGSNASPWSIYFELLKRKGVGKVGMAPTGSSLPAGYTPDQLDQEHMDYQDTGSLPRYAGSDLLPSSRQGVRASLRGLQSAVRSR